MDEDQGEKLIYARVKFIVDQFKTDIPIESILEYKDSPPKHSSDCDNKHIYTCWYQDNRNPTLEKYGIQIAGFLSKQLL